MTSTTAPTADLALRDSTEIQGDIVAGFKKDHVTLMFLQFGDVMAARAWLEQLTPQIATTQKVAAFNRAFSQARRSSAGDDPQHYKATWLGIGFTHAGLQFFTGLPEVFSTVPAGTTIEAFVEGPYERALALGDTDDNDPRHWLFGNNHDRTVHAVLTIASDTRADLDTAVKVQREAVSRAGALVVFEQDGGALPGSRRGKEHFGFKDGVSEPGVRGFDAEDPERKGYVLGATPEPGSSAPASSSSARTRVPTTPRKPTPGSTCRPGWTTDRSRSSAASNRTSPGGGHRSARRSGS